MKHKRGYAIGGPQCGKLLNIMHGVYVCTYDPNGHMVYYAWVPGANVWIFTGRQRP